MEKKNITRELRCHLTEKEIVESARTSADLTRAIGTLEDDKARSNKDFAARIAEKEAARSVLNEAITSGFVLRQVACLAFLSTPKPGMKRIVRTDTNQEVAVEAMTPDELQREFELDGGFTFDPNGVCIKPAVVSLKCPLGGAVILLGKAPGQDGKWYCGYTLGDETPDLPSLKVEMTQNAFGSSSDAAVAATVIIQEIFATSPLASKYGKKAKAAVEWLNLHCDAIKAKAVNLTAGKEIVIE